MERPTASPSKSSAGGLFIDDDDRAAVAPCLCRRTFARRSAAASRARATRGVNAATSITTSRSGNCGGSMRNRLPRGPAARERADPRCGRDVRRRDCAACSAIAEVCEPELRGSWTGDGRSVLEPWRGSAGRDDGRRSSAAPCESPGGEGRWRSRAGSSTSSAPRPGRRAGGASRSTVPRFRVEARPPGRSCRISKSGMRPHAIVMPAHAADAATMLDRSGANTSCSASCSKKSAGTMCDVHTASSMPNAPPVTEMRTLSESSCRRELAAAGAERDANGCLVRTGGRACQQERRDVGARDEEHGARPRRAQQRPDARHAARRFRRHAGVGKHGDHAGAAPRRVHGGLRLIGGNARAQPPERPEAPAAAIDPLKGGVAQRHPDVDGTAEIQTFEPIRRDAGHASLTPSMRIGSPRTSALAPNSFCHSAMADDDAIAQREIEEIGELGRHRGDGHDRRALAQHDGAALRLAGGAEPLERVALRFERQVVFVRERPGNALPWVHVPREHRNDRVDPRERKIACDQPANESDAPRHCCQYPTRS